MAIANPKNGFVPVVGQKVKVIGNCHPRLFGKIAEVIDVDEGSACIRYLDDDGELMTTSGELGGLEAHVFGD